MIPPLALLYYSFIDPSWPKTSEEEQDEYNPLFRENESRIKEIAMHVVEKMESASTLLDSSSNTAFSLSSERVYRELEDNGRYRALARLSDLAHAKTRYSVPRLIEFTNNRPDRRFLQVFVNQISEEVLKLIPDLDPDTAKTVSTLFGIEEARILSKKTLKFPPIEELTTHEKDLLTLQTCKRILENLNENLETIQKEMDPEQFKKIKSKLHDITVLAGGLMLTTERDLTSRYKKATSIRLIKQLKEFESPVSLDLNDLEKLQTQLISMQGRLYLATKSELQDIHSEAYNTHFEGVTLRQTLWKQTLKTK